MKDIKDIINEEIMNTDANYPEFGDHLRSISEDDDLDVKEEDDQIVIEKKEKES